MTTRTKEIVTGIHSLLLDHLKNSPSKAILVKPGTKPDITPWIYAGCYAKALPTLEQMQAAVGGYIGPVAVQWALPGHIMIVDEEGLLKGYDINYFASSLYRGHTPIVGTAIIMPSRYLK